MVVSIGVRCTAIIATSVILGVVFVESVGGRFSKLNNDVFVKEDFEVYGNRVKLDIWLKKWEMEQILNNQAIVDAVKELFSDKTRITFPEKLEIIRNLMKNTIHSKGLGVDENEHGERVLSE